MLSYACTTEILKRNKSFPGKLFKFVYSKLVDVPWALQPQHTSGFLLERLFRSGAKSKSENELTLALSWHCLIYHLFCSSPSRKESSTRTPTRRATGEGSSRPRVRHISSLPWHFDAFDDSLLFPSVNFGARDSASHSASPDCRISVEKKENLEKISYRRLQMLVRKGNLEKFGHKRFTKMTLKEETAFDALFMPFRYRTFVILGMDLYWGNNIITRIILRHKMPLLYGPKWQVY